VGLDQRESELRASILLHARIAGNRAADGWVTASKLAIAARDESRHGVDSEDQAARLIDDLIEWGLLAEKARQRVVAGLSAGEDLRYRLLKITDKETLRFMGQLDPIPGIADDRTK